MRFCRSPADGGVQYSARSRPCDRAPIAGNNVASGALHPTGSLIASTRHTYLAATKDAAARRGADAVLDDIATQLGGGSAAIPSDLTIPSGLRSPELLGEVYEALLDGTERRRRGAFYTPAGLAEQVAAATLEPLFDAGHSATTVRVCDPAVGGGALLLAVARVLIARGADPAQVLANQLVGVDLDPTAVRVSQMALSLLGGSRAGGVRVGDSLADGAWNDERPFDAVVTNPPFLNQLQRETARERQDASALADRWGDAAAGYADTANLFLLLAVELVKPGGRIGIILPEPLLSVRDALPTRQRVGAATHLERMWRPGLGAFDAGVRVFVCVLERREPSPSEGAWAAGEWAGLAAEDVPSCDLDSNGAVGDLGPVTADFRDQYYGVASVAVDDEVAAGRPQLITCGLIDPARFRWGTRPARLARTAMRHPRADIARLSPGLRKWADSRLVPKVVVATQTRLLEAAVDEDGAVLPVVPVISVMPDPDRLWHVLAVLSAPPIAAYAHRTSTGAALSADAIKLSARQVAALPLPANHGAWDRGAALVREATAAGREGDDDGWLAALAAAGAEMCEAYGVPREPVLAWWSERLNRIATRSARSPGLATSGSGVVDPR